MELSEHAKKILNDPARIAQRDLWFDRLTDLFDGKPNAYFENHVMTVEGILGRCSSFEMPYEDPETCMIEYLEDLADQLDKMPVESNRFIPPCVEYPIYMVHFIDKILGADVFYQDGQWNAHYLPNEVGELKMPDMDNDPTWTKARIAAKTFLKQNVKLPLFGMPTLSSALNIAVNLYGEEILVAMLTDPDAARHDLAVIQQVIETAHHWYIDNLPVRQLQPVISWERTQPPAYGQLCGCTTQLLSGPMYRDFIADLDDHLLSLYPNGGMIHLCGSHSQHIETFAGMKHLKALQLNDRATEDLELYFKGLRDDQMLYVNPCEATPVKKILSITGGKRTVICQPIDAPEIK